MKNGMIIPFSSNLSPKIKLVIYNINTLNVILVFTDLGNYLYLPVYEGIIGVILCISFTVGFRCFSIIASKIGLSI